MNRVKVLVHHRQVPAMVLVVVVLLAAGPLSLSPGPLATAITIGMYSAMAVPLGLVYGQGGVLSMAQATFAALGAYSVGILTSRTGLSPYLALLVAIVVPAVVAALLARPILRLTPIALVIATLAFGTIVEEIIARSGDLTGGRVGMTGILPLDGIGSGIVAYAVIWMTVVVFVVAYSNLVSGSRGRALNAARIDETLASSAGVNSTADRTAVFALAAGAAGAVGWFYAYYIGFIAPESLSFQFSAAVLLIVIIGGRKAVLGPVIGAVFYTLLQDQLPTGEVQNLIFGLLLAVILIFLPNGLASLPKTFLRRLRPMNDGPAQASVGPVAKEPL